MDEQQLDEALTDWAGRPGPAGTARVYAALLDSVLLLPVHAAMVSEALAPVTGLRAEKETELSLLTVSLADGRRVLPAFTTSEAMRRWRLDARPVQVPVRDACRAALDEGWVGLLLDPGSADFVVGAAATLALADGYLPVAGGESLSVGELPVPGLLPEIAATATAEVLAALRRGVAREPAVARAWLLRGTPGLQIGLELRVPLDGPGLATVANRLANRLGNDGLSVVALDHDTAAEAAQRCVPIWP